MVKLRCSKCGSIGYSASLKTKCQCGAENNEVIFFAKNLKSFKKFSANNKQINGGK